MTDIREIAREQLGWSEHEANAILAIYERDRLESLPTLPMCFIDRTATVAESAKVHSYACVQARAAVGEHCVVWSGARILPDAVLEERVSIGGGSEVGIGSTIGAGSRISAMVFLPANSRIGKNVFIGPNVTFTDDRYPKVPAAGDPPYHAEPPIVEDGAAIGAGSVILPGVRIGAGCVVGAGSVVARSVDAGQMVRGEPARVRPIMGSLVA